MTQNCQLLIASCCNGCVIGMHQNVWYLYPLDTESSFYDKDKTYCSNLCFISVINRNKYLHPQANRLGVMLVLKHFPPGVWFHAFICIEALLTRKRKKKNANWKEKHNLFYQSHLRFHDILNAPKPC